MTFDNIKEGRTLIAMLKILCLWNFGESPLNKIYVNFGYLLHGVFCYAYVFSMFINAGFSKNFQELVDALYLSVVELTLLVKIAAFFYYRKLVMELFETFEHFKEGIPESVDDKEIMAKLHSEFAVFKRLHYSGTVTMITWSCIISFYYHMLPFPCWIPFDYSINPNYFYAYLYTTVSTIVSGAACSTLDLSITYLLFQSSCYYRMLALKFETLGETDLPYREDLKRAFRFHIFINE